MSDVLGVETREAKILEIVASRIEAAVLEGAWDDYVTVEDAATIEGVTTAAIYQRIKRQWKGTRKAIKRSGRWLISADVLSGQPARLL